MDGADMSNALGQFLRRHRALTRPEQAAGRRQVPGLRRDEVARLAGLSTGYYARLEQGRQRRPSWQTVATLARALRLDEPAAAELYRLARPAVRRQRPARVERVAPEVLRLMHGWTDVPAYVLGWSQNVLARNPLAGALHSRFAHDDNMLRMIFLDPAGREFFRDWSETARAAVADLREIALKAPDERGLAELVGELAIKSPQFRRLWAERKSGETFRRTIRLSPPEVNDLRLSRAVFLIAGAPGQRLVTYQAEPGSPSADALALLATLAASDLGERGPSV
ncbi:helix-turn-helix transcriptional regulator [Nonomuraea sp. NEAU-A123]|uniref:helix-turn-helix transcriptional regulator n=1 Tax=Nonomuraea sp. NEAU-A123 TaxID=2839649 RepID=UPI001BE4846F|nr:helix-turn-helix transcriptional regulator [Nonomuraea sp. NEAU-A123]MBT2233640.1 helix-turn-helix domain-containing protein [Nonomuraea sp. NEAU-A123]